ncbi:KH domain-containing protein At4g18375-like [Chenopodium quinoa]|uniref:KH domain-containing protein At4g18375-like n=1 Tax=Chenopodium quinoa TaxID=63459 RepID=UPI000B7981CE|nr:KH domain-containing protein At4g18375-like [Chenopodium quinoa]XP_021721419.1 KH domain-containing protein At4g18375-like [Chenopodium quinoa]
MAGQRNNHGKRAHSLDRSENGRNKRRSSGEDPFSIGTDDTVYRYLCPATKIGSIIGRGGEIVKQLRLDTKAKIRIGETVPGCDERVVTIYSASEETNSFDEMDSQVCPAQDALFRVHDRVIAEDAGADDEPEGNQNVTARLLVPSDQIGCIIGKGGQIVQTIRSETGAQIRILKDDHLPACALSTDELLQISGVAVVVRKALFQIASRLHDNPSRSQHMLTSAVPPSLYPSAGSLIGAPGGAPIFAPIVGSYGGYKAERGDWPRSGYVSSREDSSMKDFSIRFVCPTANIGGVIGKGGTIINQIRQETRAGIKVDSSSTEGDDCLITISSKEYFEDQVSPTIEAARRLQPRCSEKIERDSGIVAFTTRLLVPSTRIGCLIGRGGAIITEMRNITKANIRILSKDDLPKVAADDEEMVQISGDLDVAETALIHIASRLRANLFEKEGQVMLPVLPYVPLSPDDHDSMPYDGRDSKRHGRGLSYSGGYGGSNDLPSVDHYGSYAGIQSTGSGSNYGVYGSYSSGRSSSGLSGQAPGSRRRQYY